MTETRLCEACGAPGDPVRSFLGGPESKLAQTNGWLDVAGARLCKACADTCAHAYLAEQIRSRRAQPKAELEATPPAPSAVEPKPSPLRVLAEAMRSLECTCGSCRATAPAWRFRSAKQCLYCDARFGHRIEIMNLSFDAAVQPAAVEEVRHPADWYVDPNAPDGCA